MRVVEARREADFAEEPRAPERLGELGPQNLQRYVAVVAPVAREVDGRRGAGPDLPLNAVTVAESGAKPVRRVRDQRASCPAPVDCRGCCANMARPRGEVTIGATGALGRKPLWRSTSASLPAHSLLRDVPLHDVWRVTLAGGGASRTMADVRSVLDLARQSHRLSLPVRALFRLRWSTGGYFDGIVLLRNQMHGLF